MSDYSDINPKLRNAMTDFQEKVAADNEHKRAKRNARRWKEERDPVEYEKQKTTMREEYAADIAAAEGREVRDYVKVVGETPDERDLVRRDRKAKSDTKRQSGLSQAEKDRDADRVWVRRKTKAGWTPEKIATGLAKRHAERRADPGAYSNNPDYGAF